MTHTDALRLALAALETGHDFATECANRVHVELAGYKPHRHEAAARDVAQIASAINACRAALAAPSVPSGEPVAWTYMGIKQDGTEHGPHLVWKPACMDAMSASKGAKATPLYAAPAAPGGEG